MKDLVIRRERGLFQVNEFPLRYGVYPRAILGLLVFALRNDIRVFFPGEIHFDGWRTAHLWTVVM